MAEPAKSKPVVDVGILFGAPKKGAGADADADDARSVFKDAVGWDDSKVDALHEYILDCMKSKRTPSPMSDEDESEKEY